MVVRIATISVDSSMSGVSCCGRTALDTVRSRSQKRVSRASFAAMLHFEMKSGLLWAALASSRFAPTEVPASKS
jgi:hypothetical protein